MRGDAGIKERLLKEDNGGSDAHLVDKELGGYIIGTIDIRLICR